MNALDAALWINALDAADRALLRARTEEAARPARSVEEGEGLEILEVIAAGQRLALPLTSTWAVTELTSLGIIPHAPPFVRGLVSVRGEVLVAVHLGTLLDVRGSGIADLRRVVALSSGGMKAALLVEQVVSARSVRADVFRADPSGRLPFVSGTDASLLPLLDAEALITHVFHALGGTR